MSTATKTRRNRKTTSNVAQVLDITPNENEFNPIPSDEDIADPALDNEDYEAPDEEETEEIEDDNEGGEVETTAPGTGLNGRNLKYVYPADVVTQKEKQTYRRKMRAQARKGGDISKSLRNPRAASKTAQGRALLQKVQPNCGRCGEPGDTQMALVIPGDFMEDMEENREVKGIPVHKNSCMVATDIIII